MDTSSDMMNRRVLAENGSLTARQRKLVRAMLTAPTIGEAAAAAGIGYRTAERYLRMPAVKAAIEAAQAELLALAMRKLEFSLDGAIDTLRAIHSGQVPFTTPAARVSAARAILDSGLRYSELVALSTRLDALEERLGG